jgi:mono/diheme cytochrome c family protein
LLERRPDRQGVRLATALLVLLAATPAAAADPEIRPDLDLYAGAALDYAHRCKGCHGFRGQGTPGHVPRLAGFVGWYTHLPEGREYLMRVPGVARSQLDNARLAAVLNWMLANLSPEETALGFAAFTAEEVGRSRRQPLVRRVEKRAELLRRLRGRGLIGPREDAMGVSPERRSAELSSGAGFQD